MVYGACVRSSWEWEAVIRRGWSWKRLGAGRSWGVTRSSTLLNEVEGGEGQSTSGPLPATSHWCVHCG
jgi:hypothetical protein